MMTASRTRQRNSSGTEDGAGGAAGGTPCASNDQVTGSGADADDDGDYDDGAEEAEESAPRSYEGCALLLAACQIPRRGRTRSSVRLRAECCYMNSMMSFLYLAWQREP